MSAATEEQPQPAGGAGPFPASISSSSISSSFCSFDVRIWEELHLQSLLSTSINEEHIESGAGQLWKGEKSKEAKSQSHSQGFSFFSSSTRGASFSGFSSPHRLSNASSQSLISPCSRRDSNLLASSPLHYKTEQPPVVQVIQTGSMSFTSGELVIQQSSNSTDNPLLMEDPHWADCKTTPPNEHEELSSYDSAYIEKSIVLGSLPNAKFLQISAPDVYSAPISPLKSAGSIPFKWEETPGKPKHHAEYTQPKPTIPSLQLPPKLLHSSFPPSNCNSPYSRSHSKHTGSSSPSADVTMSKSASVKSLWHSFVQSGRRSYREGGGRSRFNNRLSSDEDPWSPTSILIGPDTGLSSSSSTSSTLDAVCASPGRIPEVQSAISRVGTSNMDDAALSRALMPASSSSSLCEASAYVGHDLPNLAPPMERKADRPKRHKATDRLKGFLKSCRTWRGLGVDRKRNHEEAEMWEPTLATYFHSMELERTFSISGQSLFHRQRSLEACRNESNLALVALEVSSSSSSSVGLDTCMNGCHDIMKEDVMIFSGKPTSVEKLTMSVKGKNVNVRRKGGGWVLRKLKKSSIVLAALLRAVSKSTSSGSSKKCKRRRLPYQHID